MSYGTFNNVNVTMTVLESRARQESSVNVKFIVELGESAVACFKVVIIRLYTYLLNRLIFMDLLELTHFRKQFKSFLMSQKTTTTSMYIAYFDHNARLNNSVLTFFQLHRHFFIHQHSNQSY